MNNSQVRQNKNKIQELLESSESIGIIVGENQNIDSMGAALGLYFALSQSGKNVQVVSKKGPIVENSNLFGIDRVGRTFGGKTKILTISVPYKEGEIEKVSYNIEDTRLNVNLFAEENGINFSEKDIEYLRKGSSPSLIITIGVLSEEEIKNLVDLSSVKAIHIDKSPLNALTGDVVIVDPSFSSLSEIVVELIMELSLRPDLDALQNLMDGIVYATRNFTNPSTSGLAFEAAGFLLQSGAKRKEKTSRPARDDRFPSEDHFLNPRPKQPQIQGFQKNNPAQPEPQNPQDSNLEEDLNLAKSDMDQNPDAASEPSGDIPEDWFLPKVFKGSKKGN